MLLVLIVIMLLYAYGRYTARLNTYCQCYADTQDPKKLMALRYIDAEAKEVRYNTDEVVRKLKFVDVRIPEMGMSRRIVTRDEYTNGKRTGQYIIDYGYEGTTILYCHVDGYERTFVEIYPESIEKDNHKLTCW